MVWVRSEYAGELAVLLAWISVFVPWNITYAPNVYQNTGDLLFVRFPFFQLRYTLGFVLPPSLTNGWQLTPRLVLTDPLSAIVFQQGQQALAYSIWAVGAGVFVLALLLSFAYYFAEERVENASVDPVRVMGILIGLGALGLTGATALLATGGFPGVPIPLGVLLLFAFSGLLLTVERT